MLRLGPGLPYQVPGGVEDTGDDNFPLRYLRFGLTFCGHLFSPFFAGFLHRPTRPGVGQGKKLAN